MDAYGMGSSVSVWNDRQPNNGRTTNTVVCLRVPGRKMKLAKELIAGFARERAGAVQILCGRFYEKLLQPLSGTRTCMNTLRTGLIVLAALALATGCKPDAAFSPVPDSLSARSAAVDSLNRQIAFFNDNRIPGMGVFPIEQQVSRVKYSKETDRVECFDWKGEVFLTLSRMPCGRFEGAMSVEYHEPPGLGADGTHSWGHVIAKFYLERGVF